MVLFEFFFRLKASESVQYFQFDSVGNMFIFEPGAGFSGNSTLVRPGDEIFTEGTSLVQSNALVNISQCMPSKQVTIDSNAQCLKMSESQTR